MNDTIVFVRGLEKTYKVQYPGWLRFTLATIVPIGIAVTVPAEAISGRMSLETFAGLLAALSVTSRRGSGGAACGATPARARSAFRS